MKNWFKIFKEAQSAYGCWISPEGNVYDVPFMGHQKVGSKILWELFHEEVLGDSISMLLRNGFARVVSGTDGYCLEVESYDKLTLPQKMKIMGLAKSNDPDCFFVNVRGRGGNADSRVDFARILRDV